MTVPDLRPSLLIHAADKPLHHLVYKGTGQQREKTWAHNLGQEGGPAPKIKFSAQTLFSIPQSTSLENCIILQRQTKHFSCTNLRLEFHDLLLHVLEFGEGLCLTESHSHQLLRDLLLFALGGRRPLPRRLHLHVLLQERKRRADVVANKQLINRVELTKGIGSQVEVISSRR